MLRPSGKPRLLALGLTVLSLTAAVGIRGDEALRLIPSKRTGPGDPLVASVLPRLDPSQDGWDGEVFAEAAQKRLDQLALGLARPAPGWDAVVRDLADPAFEGGPLRPDPLTRAFQDDQFTVSRASGSSQAPAPHRGEAGLGRALRELARPLADGTGLRAEFQIVRVDVQPAHVEATVLYEGFGRSSSGTVEQTATWSTRWRWDASQGAPRLLAARALTHEEVARRGEGTLFAEATEATLGANASYREQLTFGVDHWLERIESWIESDGFGHNGIAVGDVNGDGLDDLYICQMGGLPNLLYVQNPDGTATDRSAEAGVDWLERTRSALFVDFDNDGDQDLVAATSVALLFMANDGAGKFEPKASLSITGGVMTSRPLGGTRAGGAEGATEGAHASRGGDLGASTTSDLVSLAAADYDGDGLVDLYACVYHASGEDSSHFALPAPYHDANNGGPDILLRNKGGWEFEDVTAASGMDVNNRRFSFAAAWEDYDNDGDQDLYVANDFGRKNLYRNDGGRFTDVAARAGVEDVAAGMSVDWSDYDNDGRMDLYTGNMFTAAGSRIAWQRRFRTGMREENLAMYRRHARGNSLFRNKGDGTFEDLSEPAGVTMARWAWASKWIDFNNDGWDDLAVANGYFTKDKPIDLSSYFWRQVVMQSPDRPAEPGDAAAYVQAWKALGRLIRHEYSFAGRERNVAFLNTHATAFATVSAISGLDWADDARGIAVTDWDVDGDLDVWMVNRNGPRVRFAQNRGAGPPGRFVSFLMEGNGRVNRDALGARLELVLREKGRTRSLHRTVRAGDGYLAQSSKWVHFGLGGDGAVVDRLVVTWPDGAREVLGGVQAGRRHRVVKGSGRAQPLDPRAVVTLPVRAVGSPPVQPAARLIFSAPAPAPVVEFKDLEGKTVTLEGERRMSLVTLVSRDCAPCSAQLATWAKERDALGAANLRVIALSMDGDAAAARAQLQAAGYPFETGLAPADLADRLDVLQRKVVWTPREIPLPTSFLVDGDGLLPAMYKGPVTVARVMADLPVLRGGGEKKVSLALPFAGRRQTRGGPDFYDYMDGIAQNYLEAGYPREAASYYRKVLRIKPQRAAARANLGIALANMGQTDEAIAQYREVLAQDPNQPAALSNLGFALAGQGKLDEAIPLYTRALELEPDNTSALNNMGAALAARGHHEEAAARYRRVLELDPANAPAHNNLALALSRLGRDGEAMDHYRQVLLIDPSNVVARINLALALGRSGRPAEGRALLEEAVRLQPGHPEALYHLGAALLREGRTDEARARLEEAVRLKPDLGQAGFYLSVALVRSGQIDAALDHFARAVRLAPDSPEAAIRFAWILATNQDPLFRDGARAVVLARRVCDTASRPDAVCLDTLAAALAEAGRYPEAVQTATRAADEARRGGDTQRLAAIQERLGLYGAGRPFRDGAPSR
ncbi:MAG: tetratricopeptide repeat protein [Candidatus Polarisedimenticolia bacterium]